MSKFSERIGFSGSFNIFFLQNVIQYLEVFNFLELSHSVKSKAHSRISVTTKYTCEFWVDPNLTKTLLKLIFFLLQNTYTRRIPITMSVSQLFNCNTFRFSNSHNKLPLVWWKVSNIQSSLFLNYKTYIKWKSLCINKFCLSLLLFHRSYGSYLIYCLTDMTKLETRKELYF